MSHGQRQKEVTRLLKRGLNHYGLGDLEAAIGCWEQARAVDPDNQAVHDYLETAYEEMGDGVRSSSRPIDDEDPTPISMHQVKAPSSKRSAAPDLDDDEPDTLVRGALRAYKAGQLDRAWEELQTVANAAPDRLDVQGYLQLIRTERAQRWAKEIGDQGRVLRLAASTQQVLGLSLAPEEGFLLSQVDGNLTIADLLSLSTADRVRTLEILAKLIRSGVVE